MTFKMQVNLKIIIATCFTLLATNVYAGGGSYTRQPTLVKGPSFDISTGIKQKEFDGLYSKYDENGKRMVDKNGYPQRFTKEGQRVYIDKDGNFDINPSNTPLGSLHSGVNTISSKAEDSFISLPVKLLNAGLSVVRGFPTDYKQDGKKFDYYNSTHNMYNDRNNSYKYALDNKYSNKDKPLSEYIAEEKAYNADLPKEMRDPNPEETAKKNYEQDKQWNDRIEAKKALITHAENGDPSSRLKAFEMLEEDYQREDLGGSMAQIDPPAEARNKEKKAVLKQHGLSEKAAAQRAKEIDEEILKNKFGTSDVTEITKKAFEDNPESDDIDTGDQPTADIDDGTSVTKVSEKEFDIDSSWDVPYDAADKHLSKPAVDTDIDTGIDTTPAAETDIAGIDSEPPAPVYEPVSEPTFESSSEPTVNYQNPTATKKHYKKKYKKKYKAPKVYFKPIHFQSPANFNCH